MEGVNEALKLIALAKDKVRLKNIGYEDAELAAAIDLLAEAIDKILVK